MQTGIFRPPAAFTSPMESSITYGQTSWVCTITAAAAPAASARRAFEAKVQTPRSTTRTLDFTRATIRGAIEQCVLTSVRENQKGFVSRLYTVYKLNIWAHSRALRTLHKKKHQVSTKFTEQLVNGSGAAVCGHIAETRK